MRKQLKAVGSLRELRRLALEDARYERLAIDAANNLGGSAQNLAQAMDWLWKNAAETDEQGVVDEVNFMREDMAVKKKETTKTTLRLPADLVVAARRRALDEGRTMVAIVGTALRQYLKSKLVRKGGQR